MISPLLTGTFRTFASNNAFSKIIGSVTSLNLQRDIHLKPFQHQSSQYPLKRQSTQARKLTEGIAGLASMPKQPLPPYFRFMQQVRPSLKTEHPDLKPKEIIKAITERWKLLGTEEKEMLSKEYRDDLKTYSENIANYNRTLTADNKRIIEQKLADVSKQKLIKSRQKLIKTYQKKALELNKPKKPPSSFLRYFHAQTDRLPDEPYKEHMKRVSCRWQALSKNRKKKYETTSEEMENYKKAMLVWEAAITKLMEAGSDGSEIVSKHKELNLKKKNYESCLWHND